jgi:chemotaxis protein methyltransferase CheR
VGIALAPAKRDMVYGRLSRRLRTLGMRSFQQYLDHLEQEDGDEWQAFTNALTTNLTSFFREPHHFDKLREELQQRSSRTPLLLWSCAASTGEALLDGDHRLRGLRPEAAGAHHRHRRRYPGAGHRRPRRLQHRPRRQPRPGPAPPLLPAGQRPNEGQCRVPALREMIEFRPLNLLAPRYDVGGPFDALFCRNVMIYFDKPTQRAILGAWSSTWPTTACSTPATRRTTCTPPT